MLSVQTQKGLLATNTTDAVDGDGSASPAAASNGGAGTYDVFVDKSAAGAESYVLTVQCTTGANGGGVPTGTLLTPIATGASSVPALSPASLLVLLGALAALGSVLAPRTAWSHTQNGALGSAAGATDFYQITCSDDGSGAPASLTLQILDTAPAAAPLVAVQGQKGTLATNSTDATDADATPSPTVVLNGGAGVYDVLVHKTAAGSETYTLTFHCLTGPDGTGDHTGTSLTTRQNQ